jgi:hypothetical protein
VCDPDSTGQLTVVLGGGTGIAHTDGTLTMCGGDGQGPTLTQADTAATQPRLTFTSSTGSWTAPQRANADQNGPSEKAEVVYCAPLPSGCPPTPTLTYTIDSTGVGAIDSLAVQLKSQEFPATFTGRRAFKVEITPPAGETCTVDSFSARGRVADGMGLSYDVSACAGAATPGATLRLSFGSVPDLTGSWEANISDIRLVANEQVVTATDATSVSRWVDPDAVLDGGGGFSSAENCGTLDIPICDRGTAGSRADAELVLDFTEAPSPPDAALNRLLVAVDAKARNDVVAYNTLVAPDAQPRTAVLLDWGDGTGVTQCATWGTYSHSRRTQFLDISECAEGRSAAELVGLRVRLVVSPEEKAFNPTLVDRGVQIPEFDWIRLAYTTEAVDARPDISVRIDEAYGTLFRVHGDTRLPSADLDVTWAGRAGSRPLFDGGLVISSIGSLGAPTAEVGVVCCGPEYPSIVLTADIEADEPPRGRASIRLEDADGLVEAVITDWQLCDSGGCEADVVSPGPSP